MLHNFLREFSFAGALAAVPAFPVEAKEPIARDVQNEVREILREPMELIIISDVSGSFRREDRPDIVAKIEKLLSSFQLSRDFLKVYVFGNNENIELANPGGLPIDEETLRIMRTMLYEQYFASRGKHSDSLWSLRRIRENLVKESGESRRRMLVFFWDGEPNSWDDIDWTKYPKLALLSLQEKIAAYHGMVRDALNDISQAGVEIHIVPPPNATLPEYAAAFCDTSLDGLMPATEKCLPPVPPSHTESHERDPAPIRAALVTAQARDRNRIILSVLSALAGLGFAVRRRRKEKAQAQARLDDLLRSSYYPPQGFLSVKDPEPTPLPNPSASIVLQLGEDNPSPPRNEVAASLAELRVLGAQYRQVATTAAAVPIAEGVPISKVAPQSRPSLSEAKQITRPEGASPLEEFEELLERASSSMTYFFGPEDYRAFRSVTSDFSGRIFTSGETSFPFNLFALSTFIDNQLPIVNGQKRENLLRVQQRIIGDTFYAPKNPFFLAHQDRKAQQKRDSLVNIKPGTYIRACVPDRSTRPPTSLVIEWDRDEITLFRIQEGEQDRRFCESQRFEIDGSVSVPAIRGAIDTVLTALRVSS